MVASVALLLAVPTTKHLTRPADRGRYYTMQAVTALGAAVGAKLGVLFGDALWPLRPFDDWTALLASARPSPAPCSSGFSRSGSPSRCCGSAFPPTDAFAASCPFRSGSARPGG